MFVLIALLLGIVAGLRAMTAPAAASWAARLGIFAVAGTPMAFMGFKYTPIIFTIFAIGELINDKLPKTPSRKTPPQFITRLVTGALSGATVGAAYHSLVVGLILGGTRRLGQSLRQRSAGSPGRGCSRYPAVDSRRSGAPVRYLSNPAGSGLKTKDSVGTAHQITRHAGQAV
jgi:uncharacterized membrane protein